MKIGGWRTRSVFERYAIVSRSDIADAIRKLQTSESQLEIGHAIGHVEQARSKGNDTAPRECREGENSTYIKLPECNNAVNPA